MAKKDDTQYWYFEGNLKKLKLFFNDGEWQYGAVFASNTKSPCGEQVGAYGYVHKPESEPEPDKFTVELSDPLRFKKLHKEEVFVLRGNAKGKDKVNGKDNANANDNAKVNDEKAYRLYNFISHHENSMFEVVFYDENEKKPAGGESAGGKPAGVEPAGGKPAEGIANPADVDEPKHNYTIAMVCVKI